MNSGYIIQEIGESGSGSVDRRREAIEDEDEKELYLKITSDYDENGIWVKVLTYRQSLCLGHVASYSKYYRFDDLVVFRKNQVIGNMFA